MYYLIPGWTQDDYYRVFGLEMREFSTVHDAEPSEAGHGTAIPGEALLGCAEQSGMVASAGRLAANASPCWRDSRLESVTGLEVWCWRLKRVHVLYRIAGVIPDGPAVPVVMAYGHTEKEAADEFLRRNLGRLRLYHMKRQQGRCDLCRRAVGLELAHKIRRSRQRIDTATNTHLICNTCHRGEHGG